MAIAARCVRAAAVLLSLPFLVGCSRFVLVNTVLTGQVRETPPEIAATDRYKAIIGKISKVAVLAPDSCASNTAAAATGQAQATGTVVKTSCGVEMAELERQLAKAGYVVYSWKNINNMVQSGGMSSIQAARSLGAEVLFQVNSLERILGNSGQDASWRREYRASNEFADDLGPVEEVPANTQRIWKALASSKEMALLQIKRIGAMLDVNAVMVSTGETIWFYRARLDSKEGAVQQASTLIFGKGDLWWRVPPRAHNAGGNEVVEMRGASEVEAVSTSAQPSEVIDAKYFALIRTAVSDFVERFSKGQ
jgi:hypothetical protein